MNWPGEDERVARALDGGRVPDDHGVGLLVAVADRVREAGRDPRLDPAPDFRAALRARLLEQVPRPRVPAESAPVTSGASDVLSGPAGPAAPGRHRQRSGPAGSRRDDPRRPGRRRRRAAAALLVGAVALSASTVAASSGALPGDPLYGIKRRVQGVEVALARGDEARGHRHLELARTRAEELHTAAAAGPPGPLTAALADMDEQTRTGVRLLASVAVRREDDARLAEISGWVGAQRALVEPAAGRLPGDARARGAESLELLTAVLLRVGSLRDSLRCDCPSPPADELGPVPCTDCDGPERADPAARASATPGSRPSAPGSVPSGSAPVTPTAGTTTTAVPPAAGTAPGVPPDPGRQQPPPATAEPSPPPSPAPAPEPTPEPEPEPSPAPDGGTISDILDGILDGIGLSGGG